MGIFSKSNKNIKDTDKNKMNSIDFPDIDEILPNFKEYMKDKNKDKDVRLYLYYIDFNDRERIRTAIDIFHFDSLLNNILSEPFVQKAWNDIKERYGKDVDEQELYKVFKFLIFISMIDIFLELVRQKMSLPNLINNSIWSYYNYRSKGFFDGKLDEKTFKELIKKMWEHLSGEFYEKYKQYIEQKDKQSN